jgi:hypothetical protein
MKGFSAVEGTINELRAKKKARISVRLPPTFNFKETEKILNDILTKDPPYNTKIST